MASIALTVEARVLSKACKALSDLVPAHRSDRISHSAPSHPAPATRSLWLVLQLTQQVPASRTAHCSPSAYSISFPGNCMVPFLISFPSLLPFIHQINLL